MTYDIFVSRIFEQNDARGPLLAVSIEVIAVDAAIVRQNDVGV
jgi:hypothetical protein